MKCFTCVTAIESASFSWTADQSFSVTKNDRESELLLFCKLYPMAVDVVSRWQKENTFSLLIVRARVETLAELRSHSLQ